MTNNITRTMRFPIALAAVAVFASCGGDSTTQPTFGSGCSVGSLRSGETVEGELGAESCSIPYHFWSGNEVSYETYRVTLQEGKGYWFYMRQIPNGDGDNDLDALLTLYGRDESGATIPLAISDDDAGGIDGHDSEIFFVAPRSGTFNLVAGSYDINDVGGYRLTMRECPVVATLDTAGTYESLPFADSECVRHSIAQTGVASKIVLMAIPSDEFETLDLDVTSGDFSPRIEAGGPGFDTYDNIYDDNVYEVSSTTPATVSLVNGEVSGMVTLAVGASMFDPSGTFDVVLGRTPAPGKPATGGGVPTMKSMFAGALKRR
ncbi:MAG TPA: hypothetical protein VJR92_15325 [Gemmatimonadaceae bacterium]|nr:hypothetical protein [Gemmatimonadaceae bacterium]